MQELKQFIPSEFCLKCTGCCRFAEQDSKWGPQLLNEEIAKVSPYTKKISLLPNPGQGNFICQFLTAQNNKCKIYGMRPFECQLYPFLINRRGKKVFISVDLKCHFMKQVGHIEEYKKQVDYLHKYFSDSDNLNTLKNNPQAIQSYDHILDVFELKI